MEVLLLAAGFLYVVGAVRVTFVDAEFGVVDVAVDFVPVVVVRLTADTPLDLPVEFEPETVVVWRELVVALRELEPPLRVELFPNTLSEPV